MDSLLADYGVGMAHKEDAGGEGAAAAAPAAEAGGPARWVVSAKVEPVPAAKVAAAQAAVLLALNGHPVQSIKRGNLTFLPVACEGADAGSFQVVLEAPMLVYHTINEARAHKQEQILHAQNSIRTIRAKLAELREALGRSEAEFNATVAAAEGSTEAKRPELSDIGAMYLEQRRIRHEITRQQDELKAQEHLFVDWMRRPDSQLEPTEHCLTLQWTLRAAHRFLPAVAEVKDAQGRVTQAAQEEQVLQVIPKNPQLQLGAPSPIFIFKHSPAHRPAAVARQ